MISSADFPDLFPSMAEPKRRLEFRRRSDPPYSVCIALWDEGQILDSASPLPEVPYAGDRRRDPLGMGILFFYYAGVCRYVGHCGYPLDVRWELRGAKAS